MRGKAARAFSDTMPVLAGYLVLGMGFGMVLASHGYGAGWAFCMSVFIYAGSMQYAAINLLSGSASLLTAAVATLAVNARHIFYGISMADRYKNAPKKAYLIFGLTDETYSLVSAGEKDLEYCFFVTLFNHIYWISGSVLGSVLKSALPFDATGIDFALTALFVAIFTEQWLSTKEQFAAAIGVLASALCLITFGTANFLIPAMVLITAILALYGRKKA